MKTEMATIEGMAIKAGKMKSKIMVILKTNVPISLTILPQHLKDGVDHSALGSKLLMFVMVEDLWGEEIILR